MKINNFRGDLTDISAKIEALMRCDKNGMETLHGSEVWKVFEYLEVRRCYYTVAGGVTISKNCPHLLWRDVLLLSFDVQHVV